MWKLELACLGAAPAVACQRLAPVPIWWETGRPAAEECLRLRLNADEERAFDGYAIAARIGRAEWKGGEGIRFVGGCASLTLRNAERGTGCGRAGGGRPPTRMGKAASAGASPRMRWAWTARTISGDGEGKDGQG
jgi:hypothetical protein